MTDNPQDMIVDELRVSTSALILLALIVILAALLRLPDLQTAPVGGQGDVAWVGLNALDWTDRGVWPFYVRELYSPEFPMVYATGLLTPITGISYLPQRLITAGSGLLFIALLFPAAWWLTDGKPRAFRERAGLFAALAGAMSVHAMYLSRLGMESPPFLAAVTLVIWLTAWAWRRGGWQRWALAGAAVGIAQYIYLPARVLPLVIVLWLGYGWLAERKRPRTDWRRQWRGWLVMAAAAFLVALPAVILFVTTPGSFTGRADTGTATTGGWIWSYDTSAAGGIWALLAKKVGLTLLAFGITWNGPYTVMGQPMLPPLFFIGMLVALGAALRFPRQISSMWPLLAIPVMLIPDLLSGAVVEIHALHQMGVLPFVFILAGLGLAYIWDAARDLLHSLQAKRIAVTGFVALAVLPSGVLTYRYLNTVIPAQYADPATGWSTEQIDVDLSARINAQPDRAYLLSYAEYSRSNIAWLTADKFRQRRSAIAPDGTLRVKPPAELTVVMTDQPERPRHDARPSEVDTRLWVLLQDGQTWLLPPLSEGQEQTLLGALPTASSESLLDRSQTEIARLYSLHPSPTLFGSGSVIDHPLDATFAGNVQLKGYTVRSQDVEAGQVLSVTLYWQAKTPPPEDYEIFVQLWNDSKQSLAGTQDFPYGGAYRTRIWQPDEIVATQHWIKLPDNLPDGRYTLAIGLTHLLGEQRIAVSGPNADSTLQVALAPDLRHPPAAQASLGTPPPSAVQLGNVFSLASLDMTANGQPQLPGGNWQTSPGKTLTADITWQALTRPSQDYTVFLHLSSAADVPPVAQIDQTMGGAYPTGAWRSGDLVHDHLSLALPTDLPPGRYQLLLGVYSLQTNQRLPLSLDGIQLADAQWQIATVTIAGE